MMKRHVALVLGFAVGVSASVALWQLAGSAGAQVTANHYKCYKIKPKQNVSVNLALVDQFEQESSTKVQSQFLCAPVSKNGSPVSDPATHFVMYRLLGSRGIPRPDRPLVNLRSENADLPDEPNVEVVRPFYLLVPNTKERLR